MSKNLLFSALPSIFLLSISTCFGQWNPDPTENNLIVSAAEKGNTAITGLVSATDGADGMYVAWIDTRNTATTGADIFITRILANGTIAEGFAAGGNTVCNATGNQSNLTIISDGIGGAVLAWQDPRTTTTTSNDIFAQRIGPDGAVAWAINGVAIANESYSETSPELALVSADKFAVIWRGTVLGLDLFANFFNLNDGSKALGSDVTVISMANTQSNQKMIPDGAGGFIVCWTDGRVANAQSSVHVQRVAGDGTLLWGPADNKASGLQVSFVAGSNHLDPAIVTDGTVGGAVITYGSTRVASTDANIYAQRINGDGEVQWTANGVDVCTAPGNQRNARIIRSGDNTYICWVDLRESVEFGFEIFVQALKDDGTPVAATDGLRVTKVIGNQPNSESNGLAMIPRGGIAMIVWDDTREGTGNLDIYAQYINASIGAIWAENGVPVATRSGSNQSWPTVVASGTNNTMVAFRDSRNEANAEIYASVIQRTGILPVTLLEVGATLEGKSVRVQWTTTNEQNLSHFEVEHSADASTFQKTATVQARNISGVHQYQVKDGTPFSGDNYYRIKSVNTDGTYKFSEIVRVRVVYQSTEMVHMYPNPVVAGWNLQLNELPAGNYHVKIIDMAGRNVAAHKLQKAAVNQTFIMNANKLSPGIYRVQIVDDNGKVLSVKSLMKR
jgi:hypothetical protein